MTMRNIIVSFKDFIENASLWLIFLCDILFFFILGVLINLFILDVHFLSHQWMSLMFSVYTIFVIRAKRKESKENSDNND